MRDRMSSPLTAVETLERRVLLSVTTAAARVARTSVPAGQVLHAFGERDDMRDAATQADGSTLVLGSTDRTGFDEIGPQYFVARFLRNGRLDRRFGDGGKVVGKILPNFQDAYAIAVAPDGKFVVGGAWNTTPGPSAPIDHQYALTRYNPDGSLDTTFGEGGTAHADLDPARTDDLIDLIVLPDGSIVATGVERDPSAADFAWGGFAVAKFRADGRLDASFAQGGVVISDFGVPSSLASRVEAQPDGKIVIVGSTGPDFGFARLNPDGSFDTTFGDGGRARVTPAAGGGGYPTGLAVLPDGGIVAAGTVSQSGLMLQPGSFIGVRDVALVRLTAAGAPDANFGGGDGVVVDDGLNGYPDVYDLAAGPDGSIVVAGRFSVPADDVPRYSLLLEQYSPAGVRLRSLATNHRPKPPEGMRLPLIARHVEFTRGGKVVIAGSDDQGSKVALARFTRRGTADRSFGGAKAIPADLRVAPRGSGNVTLLLDGTLRVTGGGERDTFRFEQFTGSQGDTLIVLMNGKAQFFPLDSVRAIAVSGGVGDDVIIVDKDLAIPARIDGGEGDDILSGGAGDDVLAGGPGADEILGHAGINRLFGHDATTGDDAGDLLIDDPTYGT